MSQPIKIGAGFGLERALPVLRLAGCTYALRKSNREEISPDTPIIFAPAKVCAYGVQGELGSKHPMGLMTRDMKFLLRKAEDDSDTALQELDDNLAETLKDTTLEEFAYDLHRSRTGIYTTPVVSDVMFRRQHIQPKKTVKKFIRRHYGNDVNDVLMIPFYHVNLRILPKAYASPYEIEDAQSAFRQQWGLSC